MAHPMCETHHETLERAVEAIRDRGFWSAYPEMPSGKIYGDDAADVGERAFMAYHGARFPLDQAGTDGWVSAERSPFGIDLDVSYPHPDVDRLLAAAGAAMPAWRDAGPDTRAGVCLEILHRLNTRSFEMAHAVMHTTGQAFMMAFQAGGPNAQDRGLEAVAYAYAEMTRQPAEVSWEKPRGRHEPLRMRKSFHVVPRGIALLVACNTFPTWNGYPGLFASLVTGNPVVVKPHPGATLPFAITVAVAREVLGEAGFAPDLVSLAAEREGEGLASVLATRPEMRIVDFTGSTAYGRWLEDNARQAQVYTEKAGVNSIVIDSTDDFAGMCRNIAFSLSLYSGQMCTTPQNVLVPRGGIDTTDGHKSFDEVAAGIADAVRELTADDAKAVEVLGGIANGGVLERLDRVRSVGTEVLASRTVAHPTFADATVRTPRLASVEITDDAIGQEWFGPMAFVVATENTAQSIETFRRTASEQGAITASVYSTNADVLRAAEDAALDAGVALSCNLTDGVYVNQSSAFSDFHATGANPAANASLTDGAFVAGRFRVVQSRSHVPAEVVA
ncbi:MAG: phenylacetic acid degradation protein PaaN [Streptosporangiales bacterium]